MPPKNDSKDLKLSRIYDAPIKTVWEAWTDPEQTAKWWGPRGFTLTTHSKELKPGGHWHYTMHGPDGTDYPNRTYYHEVEKHKLLVYDHGANETQPPLFKVTVTFKEVKGKTHMDMTMTFETPEKAQQSKKFIKQAQGNSTWDRLAEYLEKEELNKEVFVTARSFETSVENLFAMWTDPKHFSQWLGPDNVVMEYFRDEIREGKTTFYKMTYGNGIAMYGQMTYRKIDPPRYLEYSQIFCDEKEKLSKHPYVPTWPDTLLTRVIFVSEGENQARATVIWEPIGEVSKEELQAFIEMKSSMTQGWGSAFDKLDRLI